MSELLATTREATIDIEEFYGEKSLRWIQIASRNAFVNGLNQGIRTQLIVQPTGTGKTLTAACLAGHEDVQQALNINGRKTRLVFIAHIHRLLTQAERTFSDESNVDIRLFTPFTNIPVADLEWADLVIIDEGHHESCASIQYQLSKMIDKPLLALTATPDRADGMVIKFENIIELISREEAVAEGWLAETYIWSFVDTSGRDKVNIVKQLINEHHTKMEGTIVFMRTKRECGVIEQHLTQLGYNAVFLDKQNATETNEILDAFSRGEVDFLINCKRIGEGVDVSGCKSVLIGCQVGSYPLLNQWIGRASRPDSDCYVFELVNPLSGRNLDTTVVTGTPKEHILCSPQRDGTFKERKFDYVGHKSVALDIYSNK